MTRNKGVQKPLKSKGFCKSNRNRDLPAMSSSSLPNPGDMQEVNIEIPSYEVSDEVGWKPQWHGDGPMQGEFPHSFIVVLRNRIWKIPDCYYFTDAQHPCECPCFYQLSSFLCINGHRHGMLIQQLLLNEQLANCCL